jgi:WD40 repeat protein
MGGLVIKKAFIFAHDSEEMKPLGRRICAIFFLATPHQGADLAQTLSRLLQVVSGTRAFVQDLFPGSPALESINEEFPQLCGNLQLFSFYENKPMNYVFGRGLIVDKSSAVMNYVNERKMYLNANHRDVARFASTNDPSYLAVRNSLAAYIESKRGSQLSQGQRVEGDRLEALNTFLGLCEAPEGDLMSQDDTRVPGSCDWFLHKPSFEQWLDSSCSQLLWLRGRPGAGKTVLTSHIINHLRDLGRDCCFFFFKGEDKSKVSINSFLRSLAWQMAQLHGDILSAVLDLAATWQDATVSKADHNPIWQRLYLRGLLKIRLMKQQYWVIDALDECKAGSELMSFLSKAQELWPLSILVTSRYPMTSMGFTNQTIEVVSEAIGEQDTKKDISLLLQAHINSLPSRNDDEKKAMVDDIAETSNGCFLWVDLVLKELQQANTSADIRRVLASSSDSMDNLYSKILGDMAQLRFGKDLARTILTWTACSFRPLSIDEIHRAIELDISDSINDVERSINTCCRNIAYVDNQKMVRLIHSTARDFLLRQDSVLEFKIEKPNAHRRLTLACLQYLSSSEMRASRSRKLSLSTEAEKKSPFADYACKFVFKHLTLVRSTDEDIFVALTKFLMSPNILSWIEYLARHGDLQLVFYAGKAIDNLLARRSQHTPPMGLKKDLRLIQEWGNDMVHLVTRFGHQLSLYPLSIHHLVPPFCPRDSTVRRLFGSSPRGLSVHGSSLHTWDDCMATISCPKSGRLMSVAISNNYIAMGMTNGEIIFYDTTTCQRCNVISQQGAVLKLTFGEGGNYLASAGVKSVSVWNMDSWSKICALPISAMCIALTFTENDCFLLGALKNNQLVYWDIQNGGIAQDEPTNWTQDFEKRDIQFRQPTGAVFCPHQKLLAIIYRGEYLILWDFELERIHDVYEKESGSLYESMKESNGSTTVWTLAFSPAVDTNILVAAYSDGDTMMYDTSSGGVRGALRGVNAHALACSPDGRTLATADSQGTIRLYDMETLKMIYRLNFNGDPFGSEALVFALDNSRLLDVRAHQCRIWDPAVLQRQDIDDINSDTVSVSTNAQEIDYQILETVGITSIICVRSASIVFCGKEDGSVHVYDIASELQSQQLFVQTPGIAINFLHFDEGILTCADSASHVVSRRLTRRPRSRWDIQDPFLDLYIGTSIQQLFACSKHSRLLVTTESGDTLWDLADSGDKTPLVRTEAKGKRYWIQSAARPDNLLLVTPTGIMAYNWASLECLSTISLDHLLQPSTVIDRVTPLHHPRFFATMTKDTSSTQSSEPLIHVWDFRDFGSDKTIQSPVHCFGGVSSRIETVIGALDERLIYLDTDRWVCSINLEKREEPVVRHFFIPNDWMGSTGQLLLDLGRTGEIIFVKVNELVIIKRGLEFTHQGSFDGPRKGSLTLRHGGLFGPSFSGSV